MSEGSKTAVEPETRSRSSLRTAKILAALAVLLLIAGGTLTLVRRVAAQHALADETERAAVPVVTVIHPKAEKPDENLVLPGSMQAYQESPIYARTSGYLLRWYKDIGSHVSKGELLAEIDTPEVDQELRQAQATKQQMIEQMKIAQISASRWEGLGKEGVVSQQDTDVRTSAYQQTVANVAAADANLKRLQELETFKHVYAPFTGVLTKRNVDPGALINAGGTGREMFDLAQIDPLRVFVQAPQAYAPQITAGMTAFVKLQEYPGRRFQGKVVRTADAIDPGTRTLLTEVDVANPDGKLLPGSYGQVEFSIREGVNKVTVPVNTMLFREEGARVAIVGADGKVQLRPITIGRDFGTTLEVVAGVGPNDAVIINPSDSLEDGQKVSVAPAKSGQ